MKMRAVIICAVPLALAASPAAADPFSAAIAAATWIASETTAAVAAISWASVETFAITTALSTGLSYLAQAISGKPSAQANGAPTGIRVPGKIMDADE